MVIWLAFPTAMLAGIVVWIMVVETGKVRVVNFPILTEQGISEGAHDVTVST